MGAGRVSFVDAQWLHDMVRSVRPASGRGGGGVGVGVVQEQLALRMEGTALARVHDAGEGENTPRLGERVAGYRMQISSKKTLQKCTAATLIRMPRGTNHGARDADRCDGCCWVWPVRGSAGTKSPRGGG